MTNPDDKLMEGQVVRALFAQKEVRELEAMVTQNPALCPCASFQRYGVCGHIKAEPAAPAVETADYLEHCAWDICQETGLNFEEDKETVKYWMKCYAASLQQQLAEAQDVNAKLLKELRIARVKESAAQEEIVRKRIKIIEIAAKIARREYLPDLSDCRTIRHARQRVDTLDSRHISLAMELKELALAEPQREDNK